MTGQPPTVLLDACVLYPAGLRNLLMWLAVHDLIRPKWSEQIHDEWMCSVLRDRPDLSREQLMRTRKLMDQHAGDCLVTGQDRHIETLDLPDSDDRHGMWSRRHCDLDWVIFRNPFCPHTEWRS